MSKLLTPIRAGALSLGHRVVMAPLTRMRADPADRPSALMEEYYSQRASEGGLIISEATPISRRGYGYAGAPGIYDDAQIDGWRAITDAVHARGGQIALQLWHVGRQSHPGKRRTGGPLRDPSRWLWLFGRRGSALSMPRALERAEIDGIVAEFGEGAARAKAAGFDGVEIHGANGYLPDQFLQDGTNKRTDDYGGPVENRARFLLEVTQAAIDVWGAERVGIRLSPSGIYGSMSDSDPQTTFGYAASRLDDLGIAWIHVVEPRIKGTELIADAEPVAAKHLRSIFRGTLIAAGGFDGAGAEAIIESGDADVVAFGRAFIANPTCRNGCGSVCRSTRMIAPLSTAAMPVATPTTRPTAAPDQPSRIPMGNDG